MYSGHALTRAEFETEIDVALAGSFPASDPPPWTFGALEPEFYDELARIGVPLDLEIFNDGLHPSTEGRERRP